MALVVTIPSTRVESDKQEFSFLKEIDFIVQYVFTPIAVSLTNGRK